jgi:glycosyltransferase involved in cell wall biosynthesis
MSRTHQDYFGRRVARSGRLEQIYNAVIPSPNAEGDAPLAVAALPRPRLGVVGRLSHEKGVDVLLEAFGRVRAERPTSALVVAGDGPERANLEAQASRLGLAEAVTFLGTVLPVEPLYPTLDLVVLPSRSEGLPNVLLEALRADVPVVATRVGAVPEVLEGSAAGLMAPPDDPAALADVILEALAVAADPGRGAAAAQARGEVVRRFSLDARVRAHRALYDAVLAGARP